MLDYVVAAPAELSSLLDLLTGLPSFGPVSILQLGGCLYFAKLAAVLERAPKAGAMPCTEATQPLAIVIDDGTDARVSFGTQR